MRKIGSMFVGMAFLIFSFCVVKPAFVLAEDQAAKTDAAAPAAAAPAPAAPAPAPADEAAVKTADKADVVADEGSDDVATLKQAAAELEKAGKTDLAKKVKDIAEGMDW